MLTFNFVTLSTRGLSVMKVSQLGEESQIRLKLFSANPGSSKSGEQI